jgi:hypothetical protein
MFVALGLPPPIRTSSISSKLSCSLQLGDSDIAEGFISRHGSIEAHETTTKEAERWVCPLYKVTGPKTPTVSDSGADTTRSSFSGNDGPTCSSSTGSSTCSSPISSVSESSTCLSLSKAGYEATWYKEYEAGKEKVKSLEQLVEVYRQR